MILILLFAIASVLEAISDRFVEVYKNHLIDNKGVEITNPSFWSYDPTAPIKGPLGIFRDGWHTLKLVYLILITGGFVACLFHLCDFTWWLLPVLAATRWICFEGTLYLVRKKLG